MAHPNETLIRDAYAAFSRGDMDWLREKSFSKDITYHIPSDNRISGDKEGVDAVLGFFGMLFEETGGTFGVELIDVLANDDRAVSIHRVSGQRNGKTLEGVELIHFKIEDGKAVDAWVYHPDQHMVDDFWE